MSEILEKHLDPGKFRVPIPGNSDVEGVALRGNRKRSWPLMKIDLEEFKRRMPTDLQGDMNSPSALWSIPVAYTRQGPFVLVWPAPRHEWTVEVKLLRKGTVGI